MRNLKRALSLAMASVMLMGMMVVGSSAAKIDDFTDKDKIVNTDAVAVTSEIGIFAGFEDGSFGGDKAVTRAEMTVIICKILYGADVNAAQFTGTTTFSDVPTWAEGYVNLCASLGIVAGVGNGKFDPNATVTTAQAALMLEKALGYFKNEKDYNGNWMLAATAKATSLGMFGSLSLSATAPLTRNDVAVLTFKTLTKAEPVQYNELLGVYYTDSNALAGIGELKYKNTLGYRNFDLVYEEDAGVTDDFGRPSVRWGTGTINDAGKQTVKSEIVVSTKDADYLFTKSTSTSDMNKKMGTNASTDWTYYVDGDDTVKSATEGLDLKAQNGQTVEIYLTDKANATMVVMNNKIGKVTSVRTNSDDKTVAVVAGKEFETESFKKGDMVIYTVGDGDIQSMVAAKTITGKISSTASDYLKVDGTKYSKSENFNNSIEVAYGDVKLGDTYVLYLDQNDMVVGAKVEEEVADRYLFVKKSAHSMKNEASVVFADGKSANIDVKSAKEADGSVICDDDTNDAADNALRNKIFKYSVKDNRYTLTEVTSTADVVDIETDRRAINDAGTTNKVFTATADTVYVDTKAGKTYTGYESVPNYSTAQVYFNTTEDIVFIVNADADISSKDNIYVYIGGSTVSYETTTVNDVDYYVFTKAYVNGEKTEFKVEADAIANIKAITAKTLYVVTKLNSDGQARNFTAVTPVKHVVDDRTSKSFSTADTRYTVDSDTIFVLVDVKGEKTSSASLSDIMTAKDNKDASKGEIVHRVAVVSKDKDDVAQVVYIYETTKTQIAGENPIF